MKNEVLIKNWAIGYGFRFTEPESSDICLLGNVYGHPNIIDNHYVMTSLIINITDFSTYKIIETRNTQYKILPENVDPNYEEIYPNVYERLSISHE